MVRGTLLAMLATTAKQEAKRLSERVIAGMKKAAAKGTKSSGRCQDGKGKGLGREVDKVHEAMW
jgi:DNA invertase Pin-like site-specific DNA recombinase